VMSIGKRNKNSMRKYYFLILLLASCSSWANKDLYHYCNVFIGTACFGVKQGDEYVFKSEVDFRTYEVKLSNGDSISMYSGFHPESFDYETAYLRKNKVNSYLVSAQKLDSNEHRILIEPTGKRVPYLDIYIKTFSSDKSIIEAFLAGFKSCTRSRLATSCDEDVLLNNISMK
jgi:hypothetical protein